jgi:hypothetical protein
LIHELIAQSAISTAQAVELVSAAAEIAAEMAEDGRLRTAPTQSAKTLLDAIRASLTLDLPAI